MAILVVCDCSHKVRAAEDRVGMRAKCPACQQILLVEGPKVAGPADNEAVADRLSVLLPPAALALLIISISVFL